MARGKHAASAARRRAESAQEQLDRLMPRLVDAERTVKKYRSEAEAAPALRARIAELTAQVGMPVAEHEALMNGERDRQAKKDEALIRAWDLILSDLSGYVLTKHGPDGLPLSSSQTLKALRQLPRETADLVLRLTGTERELRRFMLEDTTAARSYEHSKRDVLNLKQLAHEEGYTSNSIPAVYLQGPSRESVFGTPHGEDEP